MLAVVLGRPSKALLRTLGLELLNHLANVAVLASLLLFTLHAFLLGCIFSLLLLALKDLSLMALALFLGFSFRLGRCLGFSLFSLSLLLGLARLALPFLLLLLLGELLFKLFLHFEARLFLLQLLIHDLLGDLLGLGLRELLGALLSKLCRLRLGLLDELLLASLLFGSFQLSRQTGLLRRLDLLFLLLLSDLLGMLCFVFFAFALCLFATLLLSSRLLGRGLFLALQGNSVCLSLQSRLFGKDLLLLLLDLAQLGRQVLRLRHGRRGSSALLSDSGNRLSRHWSLLHELLRSNHRLHRCRLGSGHCSCRSRCLDSCHPRLGGLSSLHLCLGLLNLLISRNTALSVQLLKLLRRHIIYQLLRLVLSLPVVLVLGWRLRATLGSCNDGGHYFIGLLHNLVALLNHFHGRHVDEYLRLQ